MASLDRFTLLTMLSQLFVMIFSVLRCVAWRGNDFKIGFGTSEVIFELRGPKIQPKIDTFAKFGNRDLTILRAKKVVFWTF